MHGQISVESEPGRGSTFSLTMTFRRAEAAPELEARQQVILVDSNPLSRHITSRLITKLGYSVEAFTCIEDAVGAAAKEQSAVCLLERESQVARLRAALPTSNVVPKIILMQATSSGNSEADGTLASPIQPEQLKSLLAAIAPLNTLERDPVR